MDVPAPRTVDRAERFVRLIETLAALGDDLGSDSAESTVRLARTCFGKWSVEILGILHDRRVLGFSELRRQLEGISPRVLSAKLKLLETNGLVRRTVVPSRPPRPEYALSDRGRELTKLGASVLRHLEASGSRAHGRKVRGAGSRGSED